MICLSCEVDHEPDQFSWKNKADGTRQKWCKSCYKKYAREHYLKHKAEYKARSVRSNQVRREIAREWVCNLLNSSCCVDCGEDDPIVLEFDHIDPSDKNYGVSNMVRNGMSVESIADEIAKCEIRCANCHRRRTSEMFGWYKSRLE